MNFSKGIRENLRELRELLGLGIPLAVTQALFILMQLVDVYFVGPLGAESLGGISIGNAFCGVFAVVGIGLLSGLDFCMARSVGARRPQESESYLWQGFYISVLISIVVVAISILGSYHLESLGVPPGVAAKGAPYLRILSASLFPNFLYIVLFRQLQAHGKATPVLVTSILANILNAILDWALVYGHLGFSAHGMIGAAWSTLTSRIFMFLFLLLACALDDPAILVRRAWNSLQIRELVQLGIPAGSQMVLEVGVFALSCFFAGRLGAIPLSAHHIVLQIASFTFMFPLGFSLAAAAQEGKAIGANRFDRARHIGWTAIVFAGCAMAFSSLILYVFARPIISIFTPEPAIISLGVSLVGIAAFFQIADGIQVVATGALRGIGNTRASMWANLVGHWFVGLPIGYYLTFYRGWGPQGLWTGLLIGLFSVAVALVFYWKALSKQASA